MIREDPRNQRCFGCHRTGKDSRDFSHLEIETALTFTAKEFKIIEDLTQRMSDRIL